MVQGHWELVDGPVAEAIERLNRETLANVTGALVTSLLSRRPKRAPIPNEASLSVLHRAATQFLLKKPGHYRDCAVHVDDPDRDFILWGAPPEHIPSLMRRFFRDLTALWPKGDALDVAAFALWRIVSIHPFTNGNGRTADAFAYACLCLKLGALLPGRRNVTQIIKDDETRYWNALTLAHRTAAGGGKPDLSALKAYLDTVLLRQVRAAKDEIHGR